MPIAHVQNANAGTSASGTSISATGSVIGSGNVVCGCVFFDNPAATLTSVTDDQSNTYTIEQTIQNSDGSNLFLSSFYLTNITNGPKTVTANFGSSTPHTQITWDEYSGLAASAVLDGHAGQAQAAPGTGTDAITSGNFTTTDNGDLIWAGMFCGSGNAVAGTGYTRRLNNDASNGFVFICTEDKVQSAAGSVAGTYTQGSASRTVVVALAIGVPAAAGVNWVDSMGGTDIFPFPAYEPIPYEIS